MPELPEVEHVRRRLDRWMKGATITKVIVTDPRAVKPSAKALEERAKGQRVKSVDRRGKWLRIALDDGSSVFGHLGMTGWFEHGEGGSAPRRFERVAFEIARGRERARVSYVDGRRLGGMTVSEDETKTWAALGPDPLHDGISATKLHAELSSRKLTIKEALLDQTVLAGIGNIQSIEALWKARIDPRTRASALALADVRELAKALRWSIRRTLADLEKRASKGASSAGETLMSSGAENPFLVYGRKGTPCPRCKTAFVRLEVGGRTTTLCPTCQRRLKAPANASGSRRPSRR